VARARWRQAEAALPAHDARVGRAAARSPLLEAVRIARELGARPLLRELTTLARRALINLPPDPRATAPVAVGPGLAGPSAPRATDERALAGSPTGRRGRVGVRVVADGRDHEGEPLSARPPTSERRGAIAPGAIRPAAAGSVPGSPAPRAAIAAAFASQEATAQRTETFGLSRREQEVLALIVEGRTNREIGERLFISQKTVGVHVGNILAKLGASGRVEAAMVAVRLELVPNPAVAPRPLTVPTTG
jgi:DNA-binding CsgD family transcriptional regulator